MNENKETVLPVVKNNEIDILVLGKKLLDGRKTILKGLAVGSILGLFFAILTPKVFTVTTIMLPQSESGGSMSKISSLASLAGFDLNMDAGSDITPVVYPKILESETFLLDIMNSKYNFKGIEQPVSMYDYYTKYQKIGVLGYIIKYTIGLPGVIVEAIRNDPPKKIGKYKPGEILQLSKGEDEIMRALMQQISLTLNKKEGYLTLTCSFPEALLAAQVTKRSQELLQEKITEYKIKKSTKQLDFIQQRYNENKAKYESLQVQLANSRDRNLNLFMSSASTSMERLESEYNISRTVYGELAKQLEQAKIQVKNDTPVFAILKPVVVPLKKSEPQRFTILFVWMLVGTVIGAGVVGGKEYLSIIKNRVKL